MGWGDCILMEENGVEGKQIKQMWEGPEAIGASALGPTHREDATQRSVQSLKDLLNRFSFKVVNMITVTTETQDHEFTCTLWFTGILWFTCTLHLLGC